MLESEEPGGLLLLQDFLSAWSSSESEQERRHHTCCVRSPRRRGVVPDGFPRRLPPFRGNQLVALGRSSTFPPSPACLPLHQTPSCRLHELDIERGGGGAEAGVGAGAGAGAPTPAKCDNGVVFLPNSELNTERSRCRAGAPPLPRPPSAGDAIRC